VGVLAPAGVLVISGVLADHHDHVLAALRELTVVDTLTRDGWAAITLRR
jgi:ribosomal protein L11 methylase PrmA